MTFKVSIGFASDAGQRTVNEDFIAASTPERKTLLEKGLIGVLADGVSSAGEGRKASRMAVRGLINDYLSTPATWDITVALDRVLGALNDWMWAHNERADEREQMLTTLTAIVIRGRRFTIAHVGDSRALLIRDGQVLQLTREHMRQAGLRGMLTRALGLDSKLMVDYSDGDVQIGDCFVLSSDGAHRHFEDHGLVDLLADLESDPAVNATVHKTSAANAEAALNLENAGAAGVANIAQAMADRLIGMALASKTDDNASVLVLHVEGLAADRLDDIARRMAHLPLPPRLRIGSSIDGMTVTQLVLDSNLHLLYQVRDGDGQLLALKTLNPIRAANQEELAALAYEDWITTQMQGKHFVARIDLGARQTMNYLVYRWHGGQTLEARLASATTTPIKLAEILGIAQQIAQALGQLHRRGIVHRDIKPDNLMLCDDGVMRVLDLGVAISGHESEWVRDSRAGTPSYMNPEQWKDAAPNAGSDLYALGVMLYRMLTNRLPFGDIEPYQTARYRRDPTAPSRHRPEVPIWLDRLVLRSIASDAKQRFETAEEFLLALDQGAARVLNAPEFTPLLRRDPATLWRIVAAVSILVNLLLIYFLLALPH